jgi:hypothetical protein
MWPLLLIVAAGAVFFALRAYDRTIPRPPARLKRLLGSLRSVVFILLVAAIAGPVFSLLKSDQVPAGLLVVIEDSGSMAIRDGDGPVSDQAADPASRWDDALALAAELDSVFSLHDPPVDLVFLRGNGLDPVREFRLDDPVIPPPAGHGTDLAGLLRQARDRMAGRSIRTMVLISDGQETRGQAAAIRHSGTENSRAGASIQGAIGTIDLRVVGVGDPQGTADRVIKDLRYPDTAYEGDEVLVEFSVDHRFASGSIGSSLVARLLGEEGVMAEITLPVTDRVVPVSLGFKPDGHGLKVYRLEVSALDNERYLDNNRASLAIDVRKERSRLLLLTGSPGWDVRFLAQAAENEERIQLEIVFPSATGLVFADSLANWVAPVDPAGWSVWDGVIISDWTGALAGVNWEPLRAAVENGLGLLVIPGGNSAGPQGPSAPPSPLASLLPVRVPGWRWSSGPLFAAVVSSQAGHPILEGLRDSGSLTEGRGLKGLPPLERMVETGIRPEATVLLTGRRRDSGGGGAEPALLVINGVGEGRVAWFGGRNAWELAFWDLSQVNSHPSNAGQGGSGSLGRRLLRNLLVWTSAGEENSGLVFTGRQTVFQEGERIKLAAQWRDMRGRPVVEQKLSLQLRHTDAGADSGRVRTFALSRRDGASGFAEVLLPPLPPGRYSVQLIGEGDPPVTGKIESLVVSGHSIESTQVRMDRRRLVQVAARGNGEFIMASASGSGTRLIDGLLAQSWSGQVVERRNRLDFWSGWPFLGLVVLLLGLEWFLRRRNGLL